MKTMTQKAGLGPNFKNHSGRKTIIQTLINNDVQPTDIMQLSGHKNNQSITSFSTVSQKHTLTGLSSGEKLSSLVVLFRGKEGSLGFSLLYLKF